MANLFVKNGELQLVNGANGSGYLVLNDEKNTPVFHQEFVELQKESHYLVSLAAKVKGVDFKGKKATSFAEIVESVKKELALKANVYVSVPTAIERPLTDQLTNEAILWVKSQQAGSKAENVNKLMAKFDRIFEFENFGLYFDTSSITKLEKLYTVAEIIEAVSTLEEFLTV